jgi:hypothetical protein
MACFLKRKLLGQLVVLFSLFLALTAVNPVRAADTGSLTVQIRDQETGKAFPAGYEKINPFCLVLPYKIDGQTVNNIVAQPKDAQKTPSKQATPNTPSTPSSSSSSNRKVSSKPQYLGTPTITAKKKTSKTPTGSTVPTLPQTPRLPQTGQLNWPIPLLALAGLTLFVWGWAEQKKGER